MAGQAVEAESGSKKQEEPASARSVDGQHLRDMAIKLQSSHATTIANERVNVQDKHDCQEWIVHYSSSSSGIGGTAFPQIESNGEQSTLTPDGSVNQDRRPIEGKMAGIQTSGSFGDEQQQLTGHCWQYSVYREL
ncbi:hypothetical protein TYRP_000174 [Tyrophagus putrescentiae]|nr:hypothetical protein TYRP_000174 [Tyrophagus putrescentiae]